MILANHRGRAPQIALTLQDVNEFLTLLQTPAFLFHKNGTLFTLNIEAEKFLHIEREHVEGKTFAGFLPGGADNVFFHHLHKVDEDTQIQPLPLLLMDGRGKYILSHAGMRTVHLAGEKLILAELQKNVEPIALEAHRKSTGLMDQVLAVRDIQTGRCYYTSGSCQSLFDMGEEYFFELLSNYSDYATCIAEEDRADYVELVTSSCQRLLPFRVSYRLQTSQGEMRWIEERGDFIRDPLSKKDYLLTILHDVTTSKKREQDFMKDQEISNLLGWHAPVPLCVVDRKDGDILIWNGEAEALFDLKAHMAVTMCFKDLFSNKEDYAELYRKMQSNIRMRDLEFEIRTAKEHCITVNMSAQASFYAGREVFVVSMIDMTYQKAEERRLKVANHLLERDLRQAQHLVSHVTHISEKAMGDRRDLIVASKKKAHYLAQIGHEIRTPLHAIIGFADIMAAPQNTHLALEKYPEYATLVRDSAEHLLDMMNDLLDLSKIEAGKMEIRCDWFSFHDLCEEVARLLDPILAKKQQKLFIPDPSLDHDLFADRRAIKQVLINLVNNASKFSFPNSEIRLTAMHDDRGLFLISVRDMGKGMSDAQIMKALEPYGMNDDPAFAHEKGTGLGLPLAKSLVELHGGSLGIISSPSKGCEVNISLPNRPEKM